MTGRLREEDVALVRQRSPIEEVVREHVTLRPAGGGQLKGLCPFHEERTPSFSVSPARGFYHCFGCGEGGDVITFVEKVEHLSFAEAVERLAVRAGVQLSAAGGSSRRRGEGDRARLLAAHRVATEFYIEQLATPEAEPARRFLDERGFDAAGAQRFRCGYAPGGWDVLVRHLRARGFADRELVTAGLAREGRRGLVDRFVGRLLWPVADITGDVVGFGARKLRDDDPAPKYLNTPETPIYKKSQLLFGLDLAKKEIARTAQAVVVEGYTDVMACHVAGVGTAVATCGTAFGDDHVALLRRLMADQDEFRGQVVFAFDGDAAGQKAALRAFVAEQRFVTQTFVAVEPTGLDPCDLRRERGDAAVRDLVARRAPLFEFAVRTVLARYDLELPEGRVAALEAAVPVVARIKDVALRDEYARRLAGWVGTEPGQVVARIRAVRSGQARAARTAAASARPDPRNPALQVERELLKLAVQHPGLVDADFDALPADVFTAPPYAAVRDAVAGAGGTGGATARASAQEWVLGVRGAAANDAVRGLVAELAVEPVRSPEAEPDARYAAALLARVQELATTRHIAELRSRLQRLDPGERPEEATALFGELVALEQQRRTLQEQAVGVG